MNKDYLLKEIEMACPYCGHVHQIEERQRSTEALIGEEAVEYE